ncbi:dienelactone hydrolase family protein [Pseudomonadales bacterium]|jgi:carboxymethylenebutenolidase|nr:dienelactone hydrolase family protein [Pseudomonadales bacterium]
MISTQCHNTQAAPSKSMHPVLKGLAAMCITYLSIATAFAEPLPLALLGKAPALQGQALHYFADNPAATGYLATPTEVPSKGAVILIHEWNGLTRRIKETADAFAAVGYVALAADLYSGRIGLNRDENMALVQETMQAPDQIIRNLNAALATLKARPDVPGQVATIGWCYGGGIALSFALGGDNHDGTAIFYGRLLNDPEVLKQVQHEVYGTFAGLDRGPSVEQVSAFVTGLRTAGIDNDIHIYDDVQHGFWLHVDRDLDRNQAPAKHAWGRLLNYLDRVLSPLKTDSKEA